MLRTQLEQGDRWVLSGSMVNWSDEVEPLFTHVVFLSLDQQTRLRRLAARESERYGDRIRPGGDMHAHSQDFLIYAAQYESSRFDVRSRALHEQWLQRLDCPILEPDSLELVGTLVDKVMRWLGVHSLPVSGNPSAG